MDIIFNEFLFENQKSGHTHTPDNHDHRNNFRPRRSKQHVDSEFNIIIIVNIMYFAHQKSKFIFLIKKKKSYFD